MLRFFQSRLGFFTLALITGILVGLVTVALIEFIGFVGRLLFSGQINEVATNAAVDAGPDAEWVADKSGPGWLFFLGPAIGGAFVGLLLRYLPGQRIQGIADVMEASALRAGKMDVRSGAIAAIATGVSLGTGAPLGREGPAVHIGASVTAWMAELLELDRTQSLTLLGCACAAAVTASFNTPLAGVIFALEVVVGYYALRVFAPVVVASLGAVIVRQGFYGNVPEFTLPEYSISSHWELALFAVLGLSAAVLVQGFIFTVNTTQTLWSRSRCPVSWRPAIAGLIVGLIAVKFPLVLGVGYEGTSQVLNQQLPIVLVSALLMAKFFCAALATGSSMAGGVFSPALFMGAMFGGSLWALFDGFLPMDVSSQGVYSVVAMAAVSSAMLGAPISTMLIVFELTLNYDLMVAVMLSAAMASTGMQYMPYRSFFRWQLGIRGLSINSGRDQSLLRTRTIDDYVHPEFVKATPATRLHDVEKLTAAGRRNVVIIYDDNGEFVGSLTAELLLLGLSADSDVEFCADVMRAAEHSIPQSTRLLVALENFSELDSHYAPVTQTRDGKVEVTGVIYRADVLSALYGLMRQVRSEESGER